MRIQLVASVAILATMPPSWAQELTIREIGFMDVELTPYKLVMMAKDPKAADAKKQEESIRAAIDGSNVLLEVSSLTDKSVAPDGKAIGDSTKPLFWLVAPEKPVRAVPFDPNLSLKSLLSSTLRDNLYDEVTHSLCAVVLIESSDAGANRAVESKVNKVLKQINEVRNRFERKPPDVDVKLLTLTTAMRPAERWTLWSLGEGLAAPKEPKVAVIFGKLRSAGTLLEGDWKEADLFVRIAMLAQDWDSDARPYLGTALPYEWSRRKDDLAEAIGFDPTDAKRVASVKKLLDTPPVAQPKPRKLSYEDYPAPVEPKNHVDPPFPDMEVKMNPAEKLAPPRPMPNAIASTEAGLAFLFVGLIGWIALGVAAWMLEQHQAPTKSA